MVVLRREESYELTGSRIIQVRSNSILVLLDDETSRWVPRSVIVDGDSVSQDDTDISIAAWWAEKEGIF